jgi:hypothetical protein
VTGLGSLLNLAAFLVFVQELALLMFLVLRGVRRADSEADFVNGSESSAATTQLPRAKAIDGEEHVDDDTRFLFDVVARQNERLVQNIDALDNGLVAISVGIIAMTLFAGDKWFDLNPACRFASFFVLAESAVCTVLGHVTARFVGAEAEYVVYVSDFAVDFTESPGESTASAISSITRSAKINVVVRRLKRTFMMLATFLSVVAAVVIVVGRALGHVSTH